MNTHIRYKIIYYSFNSNDKSPINYPLQLLILLLFIIKSFALSFQYLTDRAIHILFYWISTFSKYFLDQGENGCNFKLNFLQIPFKTINKLLPLLDIRKNSY
jgi:hypothetical protein